MNMAVRILNLLYLLLYIPFVLQMLQLNRLIFYKGEDDGFIAWAWNILFSLKMHVLDQKNPPWVQIYDGVFDFDLPDPYEQLWLQPLLKGYEENHPAACYIFLVMTNVGHKYDVFIF